MSGLRDFLVTRVHDLEIAVEAAVLLVGAEKVGVMRGAHTAHAGILDVHAPDECFPEYCIGEPPDDMGPDVLLDDCRTLRALALAYAWHPDYRDEWRPSEQHA